jgi:hypothetical protein
MKIYKFSLSVVFITFFLLTVTSIATAAENNSSISNTVMERAITTDNKSAWIKIDPIGAHYVGDIFLITGTTNIPIDDKIIVEVLPSIFRPGYAPSVGGYATIKTSFNNNTWTFPINTSRFTPEEYSVKVSSYSFNITGVSDSLNLLKRQSPTTIPISNFSTNQLTRVESPFPTTISTTTTKSAPLAELIVVAVLGCFGATVFIREKARKLK